MKKYLYTHVQSSTTCSSQEVEATQMSIGRQTDKQNVVYMYTGILCSLKRKEILSNATEWMKLEDIEWNKSITKRQILNDSAYLRYLKPSNSEGESRMLVARGLGEWKTRSCSIGREFQSCEMKKFYRSVLQQCACS